MDWLAFSVSAKLAAATAIVLLPLAMLLARGLAWGGWRFKGLIEAAIMLPLVLPPTVLGFYLLSGLAPVSYAGKAISAVFGGPVVFSFWGILLASLIVNLPFAVQPMQRAFEGIPQNVREAAWVSGLSPWATFLRVELALAWPGLVSALALVVAHTLGEFGVVLMVGGNIPGETQTLSIAIYDRVQGLRNEEAALMAAVLLLLSFGAIAIMHAMGRRGMRAHG